MLASEMGGTNNFSRVVKSFVRLSIPLANAAACSIGAIAVASLTSYSSTAGGLPSRKLGEFSSRYGEPRNTPSLKNTRYGRRARRAAVESAPFAVAALGVDRLELDDVGIDLGVGPWLDRHEGRHAFVTGDDRIVALDRDAAAVGRGETCFAART